MAIDRVREYFRSFGMEDRIMEFDVSSANLDMAKEFMRFLVNTEELNRIAKAKRMVTPCNVMALDDIYAAFGQLDASHVINQSELGLDDAPDQQVRKAGWQVSNGNMTVDEAVAAFGTLK
ncbi:MAG: hypothetical protein J5775_06370 [Spirochaetales bacterium]|nr:hypothetical protein [Spirochaetales bacterium]